MNIFSVSIKMSTPLELPAEILVMISDFGDHTVWRGLLLWRPFAEYTLTGGARDSVRKRFIKITKKDGEWVTTRKTLLCGKKQSFFDEPSLVCTVVGERNYPDGTFLEWYHRGKLHRRGGPAKITTEKGMTDDAMEIARDLKLVNSCGSLRSFCLYWYRYGILHRDDGPAVIQNENSCYISSRMCLVYYREGRVHREGRRPAKYVFINCRGTCSTEKSKKRFGRTSDICIHTLKSGRFYHGKFIEKRKYSLGEIRKEYARPHFVDSVKRDRR